MILVVIFILLLATGAHRTLIGSTEPRLKTIVVTLITWTQYRDRYTVHANWATVKWETKITFYKSKTGRKPNPNPKFSIPVVQFFAQLTVGVSPRRARTVMVQW